MPLNKKILIADDHSIIRKGLKIYLQNDLNLINIEEVNNCNGTIKALQKKDFTHLILDILLADGSSLEILPNIVALYPSLRILVYSMQPEKVYAKVLRKYGVYYYIEKSMEESEFCKRLNSFFNDYKVQTAIVDEIEENPFTKLSPREMEVLIHLLRGLATKEISEMFNVRMNTISTIKQKIFEKTCTNNVKGLLDLATIFNVNY